MAPLRLRLGFLAANVSLMLCACGRPATEDECLTILRKAARVELSARLDKNESAIESELVEIEKTMKPAMAKKCVGKRITDETLRCVERAKSKEELFGECFR